MVDTNGVFGAFGSDGRTIVNNYKLTKDFWIRPGIVAVLDTNGIFDMFNSVNGADLLRNWNKTVRVEFGCKSVGLLDSAGVFDAYTSAGAVIVRNYQDAVDFQMKDSYVAVLDKNGVFDVFGNDGRDIVRNWRGTVKFIAAENSIVILDKDGIMEVYDANSGAQRMHVDQVQDLNEAQGGAYYYRAGDSAWTYIQL